MSRDIINIGALQSHVDMLLRNASPALKERAPGLRNAMVRIAMHSDSVVRARRRKTDPDWAQTKFKAQSVLYRFQPDRFFDRRLRALLTVFENVTQLAGSNETGARDAQAFLRGVPHRGRDIDDLEDRAADLLDRAQRAALRARRFETVCAKNRQISGQITAERCTTLDEVIKLGREGQNCLAHDLEYWRNFLAKTRAFWALRGEAGLVAVLEVDCERGAVVAALGPSNEAIGLRHLQDVVRFCLGQGLALGSAGEGLLPEYAGDYLVPPRVVRVEGHTAFYAEWHGAVRIDLVKERGRRRRGRASTLAVALNPSVPLIEAVLSSDLQDELEDFGHKRLRKIIGTVALDQTAPTIMQHRLLAMTA
ncbi:hypothetical protein [Pacificitalea manganoxidans]|nr:hypothetical protein [Pacificitalea manganoxidans]MDR6308475.1 hypothetical protein [Pacificitalea manganoxidans]